MSEISIQSNDGKGSFSAHISMPRSGKGPGMLVIQEIFGINPFIRSICDFYAGLGYVAMAPDLFWRLEPGLQLNSEKEQDLQKAFQLFGQFDIAKGVEDLIASLAALRQHEVCTGKVGTVGYCLGGKLAYLMAARSDVDASVGYYGVGLDDLLGEAASITKPLLLHIAEEDKFTPKDAQEKIKWVLSEIPMVTLYSYPRVDHAFARIGGDHYDEMAARVANQRTQEFFRQALQPV